MAEGHGEGGRGHVLPPLTSDPEPGGVYVAGGVINGTSDN